MQIFRSLAGYSYARADIVRRAMSKKKTEVMLAEREAFLRGTAERGISEGAAAKIFEDMESFAKYAFNKSHATVYALTSYRTAYLKTHYPAEYFAALMTSVLSSPDKIREYTADASKVGVRVLRPDVNESGASFTVVDGNIRYGLLAIKNVGRPFAEGVFRERGKRPFRSFEDFVSRMASNLDINKRTLEYLIKSGAFDSLGTERSALLAAYETILASEQEKNRNNISGQLDLFSIGTSVEDEESAYPYPEVAPLTFKEMLLMEKESSGMYFSGHLIDDYSKNVEALAPDRTADIIRDLTEEGTLQPKYKDKSEVRLCGILGAKRTKTVRGGDTMAFVSIDDGYGELEVIVFARQYAKVEGEIFDENAVYIVGTVSEEDGENPRVLLSTLEPLYSNDRFTMDMLQNSRNKTKQSMSALSRRSDAKASGTPVGGRLFVKVDSLTDRRIRSLERLALLNGGDTEIVLFDATSKKYASMKDTHIHADENVLGRLYELFGKENIILRS